MKHWANTYVFDHATASSRQNGARDLRTSAAQPSQLPSTAAESHHESSHRTNSAHWSSIVDPYSAHGPAISVHDDGKLYPPELSRQENQKAASTSPCMPQQQMSPEETKYREKLIYGEKSSPGPRGWYRQQKDCDWYGATVRTANKTPLHVLGYQSEHDEDDCKSLTSLGEDCSQDSSIGIVRNSPSTASCHATRAQHNKQQSRNGSDGSDSTGSNSNTELKDANDGSNGNDDACVACFFGSSWLRCIFRHNGNLIHRKNNIIQ